MNWFVPLQDPRELQGVKDILACLIVSRKNLCSEPDVQITQEIADRRRARVGVVNIPQLRDLIAQAQRARSTTELSLLIQQAREITDSAQPGTLFFTCRLVILQAAEEELTEIMAANQPLLDN